MDWNSLSYNTIYWSLYCKGRREAPTLNGFAIPLAVGLQGGVAGGGAHAAVTKIGVLVYFLIYQYPTHFWISIIPDLIVCTIMSYAALRAVIHYFHLMNYYLHLMNYYLHLMNYYLHPMNC